MKFEKYCNGNVIIFENFISEEENYVIDNFMRTFDYDNLPEHKFTFWAKRLLNDHDMKLIPGYENSFDSINPTLQTLNKKISKALDIADTEEKWEPSPFNLIKMFSGSSPLDLGDNLEMFVHIDNQEHMHNPIIWGSVYYPNDDYVGGEIFYPEYNFNYKPKARSLVLHSGMTKHGVKKMISGNRFCLASLVTIHGRFNDNVKPARTDNLNEPYFYPPGYWGKRMHDDPIQGEVRHLRSDGTTAPYTENPVVAGGSDE
jgi:hypothetical protein